MCSEKQSLRRAVFLSIKRRPDIQMARILNILDLLVTHAGHAGAGACRDKHAGGWGLLCNQAAVFKSLQHVVRDS